MKKIIRFIIVSLIISGALFSWYAYRNNHEYSSIWVYSADSDSPIYLVRRISYKFKVEKLNPDGSLIKEEYLERFEDNVYVDYIDMTFDEDDNMYMLIQRWDYELRDAASQYVVKYNSDLEKISEKYVGDLLENPKDSFQNINYNSGNFYLTSYFTGDIINITDGIRDKYLNNNEDVDGLITEIRISNKNIFYFTTYQGNLYKYDSNLKELTDISESFDFTEKLVPLCLSVDDEDKVYVINGYDYNSYYYFDGAWHKYILDSDINYENIIKEYCKMTVAKDGTAFFLPVDTTNDFYKSSVANNFKFTKIELQQNGNINQLIKVFLMYLAETVVILLVVVLIYKLIVKTKGYLPIVVKQAFILTVITGILGFIGMEYIVFEESNIKADSQMDQLEAIAYEKQMFANEHIEQIKQVNIPEDYGTYEYKRLKNMLSPSKSQYIQSFGKRDYAKFDSYILKNGDLYRGITQEQMGHELIRKNDIYSPYYKIINGEWKKYTGIMRDDYGIYRLVCLLPIMDDNEIYGIIEVSLNYFQAGMELNSIALSIENATLFMMIIVFLVIIFVLSRFFKPLGATVQALKNIENGDLDSKIGIRTNDEFGMFADIINSMSNNIKAHMKKVYELNKQYYKFVPHAIWKILGDKDLSNIKMGSNRSFSGCAVVFRHNLFNNIVYRDYEFLQAVNVFISHAIDNEGVLLENDFYNFKILVNDFDALKILLDQAELYLGKYFERFTILIDYIDIVLTVEGKSDKLLPMYYLDSENVFFDMLSHAKDLGADCIVTDRAICDFGVDNYMRTIPNIDKDGRNIKVYEYYEFYHHQISKTRGETSELFESAVEDYMNLKYESAIEKFVKVIAIDPNDVVAKNMLFKSQQKLEIYHE